MIAKSRKYQQRLMIGLVALAGSISQRAVAQTDLHGDPLPKGAVARLGTLNFVDQTATPAHEAGVLAVAFSPDGKWIASRSNGDRTVRLWDRATGKQVRLMDGEPGSGRTLLFSPDGSMLAAAGDDVVHLWDPATGVAKKVIAGGGRYLQFSPDGAKLGVVVAGQNRVDLYNTADGELLNRYEDRGNFPRALSPDLTSLVSLPKSTDFRIRLVDIVSGKQRYELAGCKSMPEVAISSDGRTLAAGAGTELRLWEVGTGRQMFVLEGHESRIYTVAFSDTWRFVATGSGDKTASVWEVASGKRLGKFVGHQGLLASVAFSPGGRWLATASIDKTVLVWDLAPEKLVGKPHPLDDKFLLGIWDELAAEDTSVAYRAIVSLAADPKVAMGYLTKQLDEHVGGDKIEKIKQYIKDLDNDKFSVREQASAELLKLREVALPLLKQALAMPASAEVKFRIRQILDVPANRIKKVSPQDIRRMLRLVQALEHIGGPQAIALIEQISGGFPSERVGHDARSTLDRLRQRDGAG